MNAPLQTTTPLSRFTRRKGKVRKGNCRSEQFRRCGLEALESRVTPAGFGAAFFVNGYTGEAIPESVKADLEAFIGSDLITAGVDWDKDDDGAVDVFETNWNSPNPRTESGNPNIGTDEDFVAAFTSILGEYDKDDFVIVIGHSFGGDSVLKAVARQLRTTVEVDLLAVLDPVSAFGIRGNFETFDDQVKYFFNRWQENFAFPFNFGDSGRISASGQRSVQADFGFPDQDEQSKSRNSDGSIREHSVDPLIDIPAGTVESELVTPDLPALPFFRFWSEALHHGPFPNDPYIQHQLTTIIDGIIPSRPSASAGVDQSGNEGEEFRLDATASSDTNPEDIGNLAYSWRQVSGPSAVLDDSSSATPKFVTADNGVYVFELTVNDSFGLADTDLVSIDVGNLPPSITQVASPAIGVRGQLHPFSASFTDPGIADTHRVRWVFDDGVTAPFAAAQSPTEITHVYVDKGTYRAVITVQDDDHNDVGNGQASAGTNVDIRIAALVPNPDSGLLDLIVGGTPGEDEIILSAGPNNGEVTVSIPAENYSETFAPTGVVKLSGYSGDDVFRVESSFGSRVFIDGGPGDDTLEIKYAASVEFATATSGSVLSFTGGQPLEFTSIETVRLIGDYGDAPDSYGTLFTSSSAHHATGGTLRMGATRDEEFDGQPTTAADGDDQDNGDDEDGVVISSTLITRMGARITVHASAAGKLDAWIDTNRNGVFEPAEQIATSLDVAAGANELAILVPEDAVAGTSYARFRLSSAGGLGPTGSAADGEVEDYRVEIVSPPPGSVTLLEDPQNPGTQLLFINGTAATDAITVQPPPLQPSQIRVIFTGVFFGPWPANTIGRIAAFGNAGHDAITIDPFITKPTELHGNDGNDTFVGGSGTDTIYGEAGNDTLLGSFGHDVLLGGDGADNLFGGFGNDVLIGGLGVDWLRGEDNDDLLIGGSTDHDANFAALEDILAEWSSANSFSTRVANLADELNATTVNNDGVVDYLLGSAGRDWMLDYALLDLFLDFNFLADKKN